MGEDGPAYYSPQRSIGDQVSIADLGFSATATETVSAGSTASVEVYENTTGDAQFLEQLSIGIEANHSQSVRHGVIVGDTITFGDLIFTGNPENFPAQFMPRFPIPDGESVFVSTDNFSGNSMEFQYSAYVSNQV